MGFPSEVVRKGDAKETKVVYPRNRNIINRDCMIRVSGLAMRSWNQYHKFRFENV